MVKNMQRRTVAIVGGLVMAAGAWVAVAAHADSQAGGQYRLAGTYQLDRSRSDDAQRAVSMATRDLPPDQRDRAYQAMLNRVDAPDMIAIDRNGRSVSIESSSGPRVTFEPDGRDRTETGPYGRTMTTRAYWAGDQLRVTTSGNRGTDFTVTFEPMPNGLRVTRQLDNDYLRTPVTVQSFYRRSANVPQWSLYRGPGPGRGPGGGRSYIADGTRIVATLDREIGTRVSREGERFTLTIRTPGQYRGGTITGVVARENGRSGHADMAFDFDTVRLANYGQAMNFSGEVEAVRTPDGAEIRVDRAGNVRDRNRGINDDTLQNGAVGAAIGAIIGAIAGGGKGAAIGAVVGGAGTIIVEGQDNLFLPAGTEFTIVAIAPAA